MEISFPRVPVAAVTSSAHRDYVLTSGAANQTLSYRLRQNITFSGCPHARGRLPPLQRLSVARAFALYDGQEQALRYALAGRIGSAHGEHAPLAVPGWEPGSGFLLPGVFHPLTSPPPAPQTMLRRPR